MKIIFLNRYFFPDHSATSQLLGDLVFDLARKGIQTTVITSRQVYDNSAAMLPAREMVRGVRVLRVWTSRFGRSNLIGRAIDYLTFYISALVSILLETGRGDIIVAKTDPPLISVIASWGARWKGAKLVNWVQDLFPEVAVELGVRLLGGRVGSMLKRVRNRSLRAAGCNVVLGEHMQNRLIGEGVAEERIRIIHNWSDEDAVRPVARGENQLRKAWGLAGKFVVGYSGNMGRAHDFGAILGAAEILRERGDIAFLFIGDGAGRPWIEKQIPARNLTNVILKPYQPRERLAESLSVPDVHFISLNPRLEGLIVPSKFYGILAVGRPVLFAGSPTGEIANMIKKAQCGVNVGLEDARGLVGAVEQLAEEGGPRAQMGLAARAAFEHCYGMKKSLDAWFEVLKVAR